MTKKVGKKMARRRSRTFSEIHQRNVFLTVVTTVTCTVTVTQYYVRLSARLTVKRFSRDFWIAGKSVETHRSNQEAALLLIAIDRAKRRNDTGNSLR
jgi:hypothetical protein